MPETGGKENIQFDVLLENIPGVRKERKIYFPKSKIYSFVLMNLFIQGIQNGLLSEKGISKKVLILVTEHYFYVPRENTVIENSSPK